MDPEYSRLIDFAANIAPSGRWEAVNKRIEIRRRIDRRKQVITEIKARNPRGISARDICKEMDMMFERVGPGQQQQLQPLDSWMTKARGKRTWTDLFNDNRTSKAIGTYIYKIPALKTSKEAVSH